MRRKTGLAARREAQATHTHKAPAQRYHHKANCDAFPNTSRLTPLPSIHPAWRMVSATTYFFIRHKDICHSRSKYNNHNQRKHQHQQQLSSLALTIHNSLQRQVGSTCTIQPSEVYLLHTFNCDS